MEWGGGDAIQPLPMRPSWATPSLFCFIRADFSKIRGPLFSSPWNPFCMDLFIISLILCVAFYFFFFFNTCSVALFFFFKEWNNDTIFSIFTEPGKKAHQTEQYSRYFRSAPFVRPGPTGGIHYEPSSLYYQWRGYAIFSFQPKWKTLHLPSSNDMCSRSRRAD